MTKRALPCRKAIPLTVKLAVTLRMLGLKGKKIDWSHEPALGLRAINDTGTDYEPAQLDPDFIYAREAAVHDEITFKNNGTGRGDLTAIAHVRRSAANHDAHKAAMQAKAIGKPVVRSGQRKRRIPTRPFPKGHRPLRSRNDLRRHKP